MAIVSSITLTSKTPSVLTLSVVDANNSNAVIPGTISNIVLSSADSTQDTAVADSSVLNGVDVTPVSNSGGTSIGASVTFTSTALQADGVTPVVSGTFTAILAVTNNVSGGSTLNPTLVFNQ
jgi:hypothetical protein